MLLTIQNEANRLFKIFLNSYDYFYENILLNNHIDLRAHNDIGNRLGHIMPAGGALSSFIAGLYFEKNVNYLGDDPLEDKNYAFTKLVISDFLKKSAIFLLGNGESIKKNHIIKFTKIMNRG